MDQREQPNSSHQERKGSSQGLQGGWVISNSGEINFPHALQNQLQPTSNMRTRTLALLHLLGRKS